MRLFLFLLIVLAPTLSSAEGFETPAPSAIILDAQTNAVLFEKNARTPIPPASMTKIMTLFLVFEQLESGSLSLEDELTVSDDAWRRGGFRSGSSTMCLKPNERVSVEDLIRGVIVLSGNDAAITLAENISGSEAAFAKLMTERARELGLTSASFENATGWPDEGHEISLFDLAQISRLTIQDFPKYYQYYNEKEYDWCKASPSNRFNRNPLLSLFRGADGLKTGHTREAGYGLAASAIRDDKRRIVVVSGLTSKRERVRQSERLMRAAFAEFSVETLFDNPQSLDELQVYLGTKKTVSVKAGKPVSFGIFKRDRNKTSANIIYERPVMAPIGKGQKIAVLQIKRPGQPDLHVDLVAAEKVDRAGFFGRVWAGLVASIQGNAPIAAEPQ